MATIAGSIGAGFCYSKSRIEGPCRTSTIAAVRPRRLVAVKAEAQAVNPQIRKDEEKVVDSVLVAELSKPLTAYCRCEKSFPGARLAWIKAILIMTVISLLRSCQLGMLTIIPPRLMLEVRDFPFV